MGRKDNEDLPRGADAATAGVTRAVWASRGWGRRMPRLCRHDAGPQVEGSQGVAGSARSRARSAARARSPREPTPIDGGARIAHAGLDLGAAGDPHAAERRATLSGGSTPQRRHDARARPPRAPTPGSRPAGGWRLYPQLRPRVECANGESMACASGISLLVRVVDIALSRGTRRGPAGSSPPDGVGHEARGRAEAMSGAQSPGARWGAGHCQRVPGPAAHPPQAEWLAAPRNAGRDGDGRPQWFRRACDRPQG
jgi:hypothetical protein